MGYIYKITNISTKKSYVGQTTKEDVNDRWKEHLKKGSNCSKLIESIKECGKDQFTFTIICICFEEDLNRFEKEYIKKFDTIFPNGYNIREGGNNGKHSKETRKKISTTLKNMYKNNLLKKEPPTHIVTDEIRDKISKSVKKYYENNVCKLKGVPKTKLFPFNIVQSKYGIDMKTYLTLKEASEKLKVSIAAISMVCKGKRKTLLGFNFRYEYKI